MKFVIATFLGLVSADSIISVQEQSFLEHLSNEGISYGTKEEFEFRFNLYKQKDAEYDAINADPENTFTVGHNQFSTYTAEEYKRLLGYTGPQELEEHEDFTHLPIAGLEASVDWRNKGAVNAVKNQKQCGSCWAFSATCSIEGHHFIKSGKLLSLSEQQVVDCDNSDGGCQGGWQAKAMAYVAKAGQDLESAYPYTGRDGSCHSKPGKVKVTKVNKVQSRSASALKAAIAKGPTSVTVAADSRVFQGYKSGVLNSSACGTSLDHAIAAVGYGTKGGKDYYIVRNSWGASWGDRGYIMIATQASGKGICGIQQVSVWPTTN